MPNIFSFIRTHIYVILLYITSVVIVCILFPREGKFPYEFQMGKTWGHDELFAPFDFPIRKTQQELDVERDSLLKNFVKYYNENPEVAEQQKMRFSEIFDAKWETVEFSDFADDKNKMYNDVVNLLDFIYSKGIVQTDENTGNSTRIAIIRNNIASEYDLNDIFTPKAAYEWITAALEKDVGNEELQFLKSLNLNNFMQPSLTLNDDITAKAKNEQISRISDTKGVISTNRLIIERGELVNDEKLNILRSLKYEFENRVGISENYKQIWAGQAIVVIFCFSLVFMYLMYYSPEIFQNVKRTAFLLLIMVLFVGLSCIIVRNDYFSLYMMPYVFIPLIICTFYKSRIANFVYWVTLLLIGFIAPNGFEFMFVNFIAGFISIFNIKSIYRRGILFMTICLVILAYCLSYLAIVMMQGNHIMHVEWINFVRFAISGTLVFVAYPSIYIFEKTFGFISNITLMELSDTNQPLLRRLSEVAPGTFQHSLQVANLSEEVIRKIGGNPLLARTGALYHDIGKINHPEYFTENQSGNHNMHDDLTPENSDEIIIGHVTTGVEIARKNSIPQHITDFIRTHHGTGITRYFYSLRQKQNAGKEVDRSKFTYPGPNPFSKEMVVLMMCDSIEAASRSLKEISRKTIGELVDGIVNYQIIEEQYNDANITYREINTAKQIIINRLMNIYHARIEYPKT